MRSKGPRSRFAGAIEAKHEEPVFDIPSFRIGKVFGIPIEVNASWLAIYGLVTFTLATTYFPQALESSLGAQTRASVPWWVFYLMGLVTALAFFASVLVHELAHALVARWRGGRVDRITLFIFGGLAQMDEEPTTPISEFLMSVAGPVTSLVIAGAATVAYGLAANSTNTWWFWLPLEYLAVINFFVAIFNLLPGFPLDGGRVLRAILWAATGDLLRSTRWAVRTGQLIGWSMVVLGVYSVVGGSGDLIWFGLVGWFITSLAGQAYRQQMIRSRIGTSTIGQIMTPSPEYVDGEDSLEVLVQEHFLGRRHSRYPVMVDGSIVGLVTLPDVKKIERADWPFVKTIEVTNRDIPDLVVQADAQVTAVLPKLAADKPGALLVVADGRLAGIVTRADVIALVERADE